jgi:hypothetical protein
LSRKILSCGQNNECLFQFLAVKLLQKPDPLAYPFF